MAIDRKIIEYKNKKIELIEDVSFIETLCKSEYKEQYMELELQRKEFIQSKMKCENVYKFESDKFYNINKINIINEKGIKENKYIVYGQIFNVDYEEDKISIIDEKYMEGSFKKTINYEYTLKEVGIITDELKVLLKTSGLSKKVERKDFLFYILANRDNILLEETKELKGTNEIKNLFTLWNINEKKYPFKKYKVLYRIYEDIYMDLLNDDISIYKDIDKQMKEIKKEVMKGVVENGNKKN